MANVTRIKNNQITDTTITYHKIVPGTLVGSLFNANLTLNSNISIIGNLSVAGHSSSVSSTNTYVNDPLVVFNNGYVGSLTGYDIGILINRNLDNLPDYGGVNTAFVWSEAEQAFIAIATTNTGAGVTNLNNSGYANIRVGNLTAVSAALSGALTADTFAGTFYGNIYSDGGVIDNFSSGNVLISGGSITGVNGQFSTLVVTNFSTGNARITGGYADNFPIGANTAAPGTFTSLTDTALTSGRVVLAGTSGLLTDDSTLTYTGGTLTASNLSTGGTLTATTGDITDFKSTTAVVTNFSTGNAQITGGNLSGVSGSFDTLVTTNFSTGNAQITGGSAAFTNLHADNFDSGNVLITGGDITGVDGQFGTLVVTNFSTGNAQISGGDITGTDAQLDTAVITNFSTANAQITGGDITGVDGQFGTLVVTNFSTGNAQITGGDVRFNSMHADNFDSANVLITGGNITGVDGQFGNLVVTNFSSGNAWLTGGHADNFSIGATIASSGHFTTLTGDSQVSFTDLRNATAKDDAPVLMLGGLGVAKDVYVGGNLYVANVIASVSNTITVTDPLLYLSATSIYPYDYDIGFYSRFRGSSGNIYQHSGLVRNHQTYEWTFFSNLVTEPAGSTIDFTDTGVVYDPIRAGSLHLVNSTPATSKTTGALKVVGGVGITGNLYANTIFIDRLSVASLNDTVIGNVTPSTGAFTYLTATTGFSSSNVEITGGNITSVNGQAGTFVITNFSTANALITGGTVGSISGQADTLVVTNFSTANALITGGNITGVDGQAGTLVVTNFSSGNAHITGGDSSFGTLHATNFSTGNAQITGGNAAFTNLHVTNFDTANALITGGTITGVDGQAGTFVVTNFSTANAKITGGTVSGIDGQAGTLVVTNFSTANAKITGGTITGMDAAFNTLYATNFGTGNAQITGGNVTNVDAQVNTGVVTNFSTANAKITGGTITGVDGQASTFVITNFSTANAKITGGTVDGTPIGDNTASTGKFTSLSASGLVYVSNDTEAISSNIGSVVLAGGLAVNKQIQVGGNLVAAATTASTTYNTGSFVANGGVGIAGAVYINKGVVVNEGNGAYDFVAKGVNSNTLLWARSNSTYDQVAIGVTTSTGSLVPGAKLQINSTDSILLPSGTNGDRPGSAGFSDVAGMLRFSTTAGAIEWYNGSEWQSGSTAFTVIADQQFNGDDTTVAFTLSQAATTNSIIVSINGVVQIPTLAYAVGGVGNTTLTFTEAPATGDVIDVRLLTTTQTVTHLSSTNGYMQLNLQSNSIDLYTGVSSATNTTSWNSTGAQVSKIPATSIATSGVATTIDSFDKTVYRTAKYVVQASISGSYHAQEVLIVHDGSTATAHLGTAVVTSGSLGSITTSISGSNVVLQFTASNNNTDVRIKKDYILI